MLTAQGGDRAYILSVLARPDSSGRPAVLSTPGEATLNVPGRMEIWAETVSLNSEEAVDIVSSRFDLRTVSARARFWDFHFSGNLLSGRIDRGRAVYRHLETAAERWVQRIKRSYRQVEEFEESRLGRIRMVVKGLFAVSSRRAAIQSEDAVSIDADKINLG